MVNLPAGTVTFLFTDIEGSTRLLQEHPREMGEALARHHDLLREAVEKSGGVVFETLGDGVYASFGRASDGIRAAIEGQRVIQSEDWSAVGKIRVRMGLHTGDVEVRGEHYFGPALFRCARLMAIGYGGQVLVSRATRDLMGDGVPLGATLRSLGIHRLKDLAEPTDVYQLVHPDLQAEFPPLKSLDVLANNLPIQATRFIGREREVAAVREMVLNQRLVTLTGMGGAGKTRLSLQVAADLVDEFPDGVWLAEMGPVADPALVPQTVATVLSVREEPGRSPMASVTETIRNKHMLLLLDSCEHVVQACAEFANAVLRGTPRVHLLVTSREVLGISGEITWRVPSLSLPPTPPPPPESLDQYEAVGLFLERARAANPNFEITAQNASSVLAICARLDGIPLAIELAAARVRMLSVEQIEARLGDRFRLLTGGSRTALPRQQTLRALVDWSYGMLQESERLLFQRLSVFAGGWTLEAAETVCAGEELDPYDVLDLMVQLVDKSLVIAEEHGGQERYRMLETIREYGRERLTEANETAAFKTRHADWCLMLAEHTRPEDYASNVAMLGNEYDNLRAALRWTIDSGDSDRALRLAAGLWDFWSVRGYYTEGRAWLAEILAIPTDTPHTVVRARALQTAGHLANSQGDYSTALDLLEESRAISTEVGDDTALAASLHILGNTASGRGALEQAARLYAEARRINRQAGNRSAEILNMLQLADISVELGDAPQARALALETLAVSRERKQRWGIARSLYILGRAASAIGDIATAARLHSESLEIQTELADKQGRIRSLAALARVAQDQGETTLARQRYVESLIGARDSYQLLEIVRSLEGLAELEAASSPLGALRLVGAAGALRKTIGAEQYAEEVRRQSAWLQPVYEKLGEKACAEARAAGRAMSIDQAIEDATTR